MPTKRTDPHKAAKNFEKDVLAEMRLHERTAGYPDGALAPRQSTRLGDGMERIQGRGGVSMMVHRYKMPSDHMGWLYDGGNVVLVEAKRTANVSLAVVPSNQKGSGLKEHQMRALVSAQVCGGVGLLVVCMRETVWLLNGIGLGIWIEGGDASGDDTRRSISEAHFREYGECLGTEAGWQFHPHHFAPQGKGTKFLSGPLYLMEDGP